MPAEKHPAYREELERCSNTLEYVEKSLANASDKKERIDKDLDFIRKHYNPHSSTDYTNLMVNTLLHDTLGLKLRNLKAAVGKPYFARVDFKEKEDPEREKLYIGKMSLAREEDQQIIIVDWRAPIANLYYEGRLGEVSYLCPNGNIDGDLLLKRQFSINEGILQEIFDIDITTNDEFLQSYLGANADSRLKEIVSTIQVEQNAIVRADMWTPLIVQGAAGSGKTTIALHRIAYLIYTYEKTFEPENFMIIAPNRLFLNYISEVLPELGVERVKQTTFEDFALELIGKKLKIRDANEKLIAFVDHNTSPAQRKENEQVRIGSELKASMLFKEVMDDYVAWIEQSFIPREDFKIGTRVIYTYEEINHLFLHEYKMWPVVQRINEIKKSLTNRLKARKEQIINQLHDECDNKIKQYKAMVECPEQRQMLIIQAINKKNEVLDKLDKYSKTAVKEYTSRISKLDPFAYYKEFFMNRDIYEAVMNGRLDTGTGEFIRQHSQQVLKSGFVEIEDLAPMIYLKYCIYGMDEKIPVRHIVIDEAQDFSAFQIFVLRKIVKDSSFTILGDLCQGIHSYRGIQSWTDIVTHVFGERRCQYLTLEQSYRTTVEIMEAANKVIAKLKDKGIAEAKPVIRHGEKVRIIEKGSIKDTAEDIAQKIDEFQKANFKSIAIICKTMNECKTLQELLKKHGKELFVITGKEEEYKSGIVIVPSYLSKGLEFDAVLIANASSEQFKEDELDIKLLYVSMTRSLHKLYIYYHGELSPLLDWGR
jgi:DNA helicase II / ATP-dependent DNA helicase PcrA